MFDVLTNSLIFRPPPKPTGIQWRKDSKNSLLRPVTGNHIHCMLVCPFDKDTSIQDFKSTKNLIICFHGNAEDVHTSKSYCQWLADSTKSNVITCDYPGYGFSTGSCSESSMNDAAVTLLDFALSHLNHKMNEIFIIGKSLGSTPAIYTASQAACYDLAGIVLIAPIASGVRCLSGSNNIPEFILNRLDQLVLPNITRIKDVCCPIQFIHGEQDNVVPVSNTRALMVALHSHCMTKPLFLDCSHNDIESKFSLQFTNTIETFMQKCEERSLSKSAYFNE